MNGRKVTRVLVMLEYGPGDPDTGEVFDLTELVKEMQPRSKYGSSSIKLEVEARTNYEADREQRPVNLAVNWGGWSGGEFCHNATHVADVVNFSLPDGERVTGIKRKVKSLRKKAESLEFDAGRAKLEQVAAVRHQHPIARVTPNGVPLPESPSPLA